MKHLLEQIELKPRTTVKRFAADLKARIERAAVAFDQPGQDERVVGMRYVLGIVDAALSDYDVRDPGDATEPAAETEPRNCTYASGGEPWEACDVCKALRNHARPAKEPARKAVCGTCGGTGCVRGYRGKAIPCEDCAPR